MRPPNASCWSCGSAGRLRALGVMTAVGVLWGIGLLLFARSAADALAFLKLSLFVIVFFVAGGVALSRFAGLDLRRPADAALAPVLGLLYCDVAYFVSMWLGRWWLFWPLASVPFVLYAVVRRRRRAAPVPDGTLTWSGLFTFSWPKTAVAVLALAWLAATVPRISYRNLTTGPEGLRAVTPYIDQASYLANAAALKRRVPPENPDLAGVRLSYHYFGDMVVAMLSKATATELVAVYRFVFPLLQGLLIAGLLSLAWTVSRGGWAVCWACVIALMGGDLSIWSLPLLPRLGEVSDLRELLGRVYLENNFWGNPALSWLNSLPQLAGTMVALAAIGLALRYHERGKAGLLVAAAATVTILLKFKSPHFFVVGAGLIAGGAYACWRRRRPRLLAVAGLAAVLAAPALLGMIGAEEKPTLRLASFPYCLLYGLARSGAEASALRAVLAVELGFIGFLGLRLLALVPRKEATDRVGGVVLYAAGAAGLALFFFTVEAPDLFDAFNTVWPARLALTVLAVPAGAGMAALLRARGCAAWVGKVIVLVVAVPVFLGAAAVIWVYPSFRPSFVPVESVEAYRYIRQVGRPGSRLVAFHRRLYAAAFSEHAFYVNPWGPLAYTRRTSEYRKREPDARVETARLYHADARTVDAWLRRHRVEFVLTSRSRPLPPRLGPAIRPVRSGPYGILWRATWAMAAKAR